MLGLTAVVNPSLGPEQRAAGGGAKVLKCRDAVPGTQELHEGIAITVGQVDELRYVDPATGTYRSATGRLIPECEYLGTCVGRRACPGWWTR